MTETWALFNASRPANAVRCTAILSGFEASIAFDVVQYTSSSVTSSSWACPSLADPSSFSQSGSPPPPSPMLHAGRRRSDARWKGQLLRGLGCIFAPSLATSICPAIGLAVSRTLREPWPSEWWPRRMTREPSGISQDGFTVLHDRRLRRFSDRPRHHTPQVCDKILVRQRCSPSGSPAVAVEKEEITTESPRKYVSGALATKHSYPSRSHSACVNDALQTTYFVPRRPWSLCAVKYSAESESRKEAGST